MVPRSHTVAELGAGSLLQHSGHARQHLVGRVGVRDSPGEVAQHFVRGRALAVDEAVGDLLRALAHRLEADRHNRGGQDRQCQIGFAAAPYQGSDPDGDTHVRRSDEDGQRAVNDCSADDDVDVVQAVLQHGDADGDWERNREPQEVDDQPAGIRSNRGLGATNDVTATTRVANDCEYNDIRDPFQLLAFLTPSPAQTDEGRCSRQ